MPTVFGIPFHYVMLPLVIALFILPFLLFGLRRKFSGRDMLIFTVGMFALIIVVNIGMAYVALGTFPGVEVKNSYVASQGFDKKRAEQERLGWRVEAEYGEGQMVVRFVDGKGRSVAPAQMRGTIARPTHMREDVTPEWRYYDGAYRADVDLAPGRWNLRIEAMALDGTTFRQRIDEFPGYIVPQS